MGFPESKISTLNRLACMYPCQRFTYGSRAATHYPAMAQTDVGITTLGTGL